ncbi:MOSC domain-containing protein [Paracoccus sp. M683]|uniref:MOSC domain-containing protein n=1 Tax=Paracoccus sp. M683 TaxID=2594268 RepID=UPI00117C6B40|nr:MOSC domain-containing protein [Paracoccus sp. M683]TRW97437.1 MOSC domain-containing protein [Paracoccus sp. M683]
MTAWLAHIRRHPIKTLGADDLDQVELTAGARLPGDRLYAIMHEGALRHLDDGQLTRWLPKAAFLRGAASLPLQAVKGGWRDGRIHLTHPHRPDITLNPEDAADQQALIDWLKPLWGEDKSPAARLVRGPEQLTDGSQPQISILSLPTLRALERHLGQPLGIDRWRANLWVDGWDALAERDLIGREITIGPARMIVRNTIGRCIATDADTATGQRQLDMLAALRDFTGTENFGIFAEVTTGGRIAVNDKVHA